MPVFVLVRERGPRWDASRGLREQDAWDEHATFMEALAEDGFIYLGGPVGDDRVMHVVVAEKTFSRSSRGWPPIPGSRWGCCATLSIERWHVLLGDPPA